MYSGGKLLLQTHKALSDRDRLVVKKGRSSSFVQSNLQTRGLRHLLLRVEGEKCQHKGFDMLVCNLLFLLWVRQPELLATEDFFDLIA